MIARVATFNSLPDGLGDEALDLLRSTVRRTPGYVAGFHLRRPETNRALSITVYENRDALAQAGKALAARPNESKVGIDPDEVEFFEATAF